jgi:hypothetical protein
VIGAITAGLFGTGVPPVTNSYESIATVTVGGGGSGTVTFSSIPSSYKHLQVRITALESNDGVMGFRFNSDSGNNYTIHELYGTGSSAAAYSATSQSNIGINYNYSASPLSDAPSVAVVDLLDYTNTSKNTTLRALCGVDYNGSGYVRLDSGVWLNTAAVSQIDIVAFSSKTFNQYSSFALYGIKG